MTEMGSSFTRRAFAGGGFSFASALLMAIASRSQEAAWPRQPVRLVTPSAPGSSTDFAARAYAERLSAHWNNPVVVEARTGAQGALAVKAVLERANDAHALLFSPTGIVTLTPLLSKAPPFDTTAVVPISLAAMDYLTVAASVGSGVRDLKEFVEVARRQPGKLNVAAGIGGPTLALANFRHRRKLDVVQVPYRSPPDAIGDLAADRIQLLIGPLAPTIGLARNNQIRLLAMTNPERSSIMPDVPTALEQGFNEITFEGSLGVFAAAGMNASTRQKIADAIELASKDNSLHDAFQRVGLNPKFESGELLRRRLGEQTRHWKEVIRETGFQTPG